LLIEVDLERGEIDAATTTAAALERVAAVVGASVAAVAASARASGLVHLARGEREAAIAAFSVAVQAFADASLPYEEGCARLELARSLAPAQPAVAVAEARNALRGFERVGATVKTAEAAALLRSLGARTSLTRPVDHSVLTAREREVLVLVGHGLTNPEIAERLFISRKTASNHVSAILAKLGLRNRVELAAHGRAAPRTVP
jgi:DNA-binding NarL/FixJ family response regulator